ncbi:MAG: cysteine desulfurase family protein [Microgenomates group bacterium]|nr:cysteine desulfurase family protein [Microgenomates group bacterium]
MKKIYLDYAATTPVDPRVFKAMRPYFSQKFGNTMSLHWQGRQAAKAVEKAREKIAKFIGADPEEIIFTSSATESNNLAIKGTAFAHKSEHKNHLIISPVEHDCVIASARWLEKQGFEITWLKVDKSGLIDLEHLKNSIKKNTLLVSVIHGNNEIGTVQDIAKIGEICQKNKVYFHTDASQSFGKIPIDVVKMKIDLLTASSHKIYGPKGAAILYINHQAKIEPIIHGGGHEKNLRSSTLNVPAIVGMGKAVEILQSEGKKENLRMIKLRDFLINKILTEIPGTHLNGHRKQRLCNNINITFSGVEGESLTMELDFQGIAVSSGSACSSRNLEPSHVLTAIGLMAEDAHGSLRISLGRWTTKEELIKTLKILKIVVKKLRTISPVAYEK